MGDNQIVLGLATIVVFGVGAQWIARRRAFPSLLLLLPAGLLAGSVLGLVEPEELFGDTLFPGVTLLVGLLLFQSGLQLRFRELPPEARRPVLRLVTVGAAITFVGSSLAVWLVIDPGTDLAFLTGAILVVSGPTVVGPLLHTVRPREPTDSILRWEGTMLDPIGAILGVVVLNLILASERVGIHPLLQMGGRLALGAAVGVIAGVLLVFVMSRFLVTDNMEAAVALLFAVGAFTTAELIASEAGLFATVVLGVVAANQTLVPTSRISGFGETLEVLIIGSLFIVLGALVDVGEVLDSGWRITALVAVLVIVVRPLAVAVSMMRSTKVPIRDRAFMGWVDPRGVVAASTAAAFTGSLTTAGFAADFLLPTVFGVILGTGVIYGLTAGPVAQLLGVREPPPEGVALVGNEPWMADLAGCLHQVGVPVLVITASVEVRLEDSRSDVLTTSIQNPEAELLRHMSEVGVAKAIVSLHAGLTENLVTAMLIERLGRRHVYRLLHGQDSAVERTVESAATALAFGPGVTDVDVAKRIEGGAVLKVLEAGEVEGALVVASVDSAGHVNLRPYRDKPGAEDLKVGLG